MILGAFERMVAFRYLRARRQAGVLGWVIRAAQYLVIFNFFLLPYERAMVFTGDRLAVAVIDGDISSAVSAIQKLFVGRQLGYSISPEGIIAQQRQIKGTFFAFLARIAKGVVSIPRLRNTAVPGTRSNDGRASVS